MAVQKKNLTGNRIAKKTKVRAGKLAPKDLKIDKAERVFSPTYQKIIFTS
jgi:hypothetical protein